MASQTSLPQYDRALRSAKDRGKLVQLHLAAATVFSTEGIVQCKIVTVDKYSVLVETQAGSFIWIAKAMIVGTEIAE